LVVARSPRIFYDEAAIGDKLWVTTSILTSLLLSFTIVVQCMPEVRDWLWYRWESVRLALVKTSEVMVKMSMGKQALQGITGITSGICLARSRGMLGRILFPCSGSSPPFPAGA